MLGSFKYKRVNFPDGHYEAGDTKAFMYALRTRDSEQSRPPEISGTPVSWSVSHGNLDLQLPTSHKSCSCPDVADLSWGFWAFKMVVGIQNEDMPTTF